MPNKPHNKSGKTYSIPVAPDNTEFLDELARQQREYDRHKEEQWREEQE